MILYRVRHSITAGQRHPQYTRPSDSRVPLPARVRQPRPARLRGRERQLRAGPRCSCQRRRRPPYGMLPRRCPQRRAARRVCYLGAALYVTSALTSVFRRRVVAPSRVGVVAPSLSTAYKRRRVVAPSRVGALCVIRRDIRKLLAPSRVGGLCVCIDCKYAYQPV